MKVVTVMLLVLIPFLRSPAAGQAQPEEWNFFSGRPQFLPETRDWQLVASHGRILASGQAADPLQLPELRENTSIRAVLEQSGPVPPVPVRIWSPRLLDLPKSLPQLEPYRLLETISQRDVAVVTTAAAYRALPAALILIFPDSEEWRGGFRFLPGGDSMTLVRFRSGGRLGITSDRNGDTAVLDAGDGFAVVWRKGKYQAILFSPDFDFDKIDNILWIRKKLKETRL